MPHVDLHHDCFDVQMEISGEAPTDVHAMADRMVELARRLVGEAVAAQLRSRPHRELGPRGVFGNSFGSDCEPECPDCGSGAAYRKGSRSRAVEVRQLGRIEVERPYLECRACGRSYAPYAGGVPDRRRYGRQAIKRPMEATLEVSYRRGAEAYPESPSASTLWRRVQETQPAVESDPASESRSASEQNQGEQKGDREAIPGTCVADATRIPAREADVQHSLSIAHAVRPDRNGGPGGRPALVRQPVTARAGSETRLRTDLQSVPIQSLITDGQMGVSGVAPLIGRCCWHLPRSIRYELYNDDVSGDFNERLTESLRSLVHEGFPNGVAARQDLTRWAAACRLVAPQSATTVERAAPRIAIYADRPEAFTVETTAPAEREMRELNRRFENGGQWTQPGAENLLRWHQIYRHAPEQWAQWLTDPEPT